MSTELDEVRARIAALEHTIVSSGKTIEQIKTNTLMPGSAMQRDQRIRGHQSKIDAASEELKGLQLRERQLLDHETAVAAARAEAEARIAYEERAFWFRRFHTSLAIAHGAGLAAIASKLLEPDMKREPLMIAMLPLSVFALGMVLAGFIPYALAREERGRASWLANTSGILFIGGLVVTIGSIAWLATIAPPASK